MRRHHEFACIVLLGVFTNIVCAQGPQSGDPGDGGGYPFAAESRPCRNCGSVIPDFKGWTLAGSAPQDYTVGYVTNGLLIGSRLYGLISSKADANGAGFGTIMQMISAVDYRGKRVRFSALLRPHDVDSGAGLWFRVDAADGKVLAFDNMQSRPVLGTQEWKRYEVVVDVPEQGTRIAFGVLLIGKGKLGIDALQFEKVGRNVATTEDDGLPKS